MKTTSIRENPMTTDRRLPVGAMSSEGPGPRRSAKSGRSNGLKMSKRPHPARNARILTTGAAAGLTFGVIVGLAINDPTSVAQASVAQASQLPSVSDGSGLDPGIEMSVASAPTAATVPTTIVVIQRIHVLPAPTTIGQNAPAEAVVFTPKPATRAVATKATVSKTKLRVSKAKPATRAS